MKTGVCYYPEHWPEARWIEDARHMRSIGLSIVRIGEFAWSRLETRDGSLHLDWLERAVDTLHEADPADRETYLRTGHPDGSAFHHDLYRGCCNGRWWVMEQQPGPVNWAPFNPSPRSGMVRLWGWEAFAHGAEVMGWFRWRQLPFAQEQTHAGLLLSNGQEDSAAGEVALLNQELQELASFPVDELSRHERHTEINASDDVMASSMRVRSDVAIAFSYEGIALQNIQSPGGSSYTALSFCQRIYSACRQWGVNVDIVAPEASLPDTHVMTAMSEQGRTCNCMQWREHVVSDIEPRKQFDDGWGFHYERDWVHYLNSIPDRTGLVTLVGELLDEANLPCSELGPHVRTQRVGPLPPGLQLWTPER